jgi:hypothetical protein
VVPGGAPSCAGAGRFHDESIFYGRDRAYIGPSGNGVSLSTDR